MWTKFVLKMVRFAKSHTGGHCGESGGSGHCG